jgi:hypothetical protein
VLLGREVPDFLVTSLVTAPLAVTAAILERVRPERSDYKKLDQPFWIDAAHFLIPYQFGYALALGGLAAFVGFAPLVALGAPGAIITWIVTISGALGVLEHANMRMRTPVWLGYIVCTPALHRHHHSKALAENNRNFGTLFMFFDLLFGSYERPRPDGPEAVGIEGESLQRGFLRQVFGPFRAAR